MKSQDRCRYRQRTALVQTETLHVPLPQIERDDVAISAEQQAASTIREAEAPGSESQPALVRRQERLWGQVSFRDRSR